MDASIVAALSALAFETTVGNRSSSSFPSPLEPEAVVDVATVVGDLYLHAEDKVMTPWIAERREWEPAETLFLQRSLAAGETFVDVGANVGYFSVLGSKLVGPEGSVISVEPEERNIGLLKANLWRNDCTNAIVLPLAAGSSRRFLPLSFNESNRGDHQAGGSAPPNRLVPSASLDALLGDRTVEFVKIDTQGYDHEVIAGLEHVLHRDGPIVLSEFWVAGLHERGIDPRTVADAYSDSGYQMHLLDERAELRLIGPEELVETASTVPPRYVNVVLSPPGRF